MKPALVLLGLVLLLDVSLAAEESCVGTCGSFDALRKCQCDSMCVYYGSCCEDFDTVCPKKIARGDTFEEAEEQPEAITFQNTTTPSLTINTEAQTTGAPPPPSTSLQPPAPVDYDAAPCSARPFDAFLQLKNESIYAFRGEYFFELDDKSILPGYPKLIQDVWGISGPIDAAFTRINCQGKTYIFKGNKYWRFDGDTLDEDYPRDISVGFEGIPDNINAVFAIPAPNHRGSEKAFFFKGDQYYTYEFKHQPSHEECFRMSSPSVLFSQYTDLFCDQTWENVFAHFFGGPYHGRQSSARLISRDWQGIGPPVDAAFVGRVHLSPKPTPSPPLTSKRRGNQRRRPSKRRGHGRRLSRHALLDLWGYDDSYDLSYEDFFDVGTTITQEHKTTPVQKVYFFKRDKYYRVDLQKKRVDFATPSYPRSIAKYWLGCKQEDTTEASRAEKK